MDALTCAFCEAVGTPMTMYWHPVEGDLDDEGLPVPVYGVVCLKHALEADAEHAWWSKRKPMPGDTVEEQDRDDDRPTNDDLLAWIHAHGINEELFVEECAEGAGVTGHVDRVPYGSTMVDLPPVFDWAMVPEQVQLDTALTWWEDGRIDWVLDDEHAQPWRVFLRDTVDGLGQVHLSGSAFDAARGWKPGKGDVLVETCATREEADAYTTQHADPASGSYVGNLLRDGIPVSEAVRRVYRIEKADRTMSLRLVGTTTPRSNA